MTYSVGMARWEANPSERLARAALDLFAERGYDTTTVADIAERAGLTKSTFFRHFDDKREVLFGGQEDMVTLSASSVASAPPGETPLGCVAALLETLAGYFPLERRALAVARSAVIADNPELRERELLKRAQLVTAIEQALRSRDIDDVTTRLAAAIAMLAFDIAYSRWTTLADQRSFSAVVTEALSELVGQAAALARPTAAAS
jgi:AcrR family transcriptional regulator